MKFTKILSSLLLCIILLLSLCSCVEEESEETLKMPEIGSMVEYRISDTEYIIVLFNDYYSNYGEWIKDGEATKIFVDTNEVYWGIFTGRMGITELNIVISELTLEKSKVEKGKILASTDEGFLNSTMFTIEETGEILQITNIKVSKNYEGNFDWATPEWKKFCSPKENEYYKIEKLSVKINSVTREGEWSTNEITVPVKIVFDEWFYSVEIFDISGEEDCLIFYGNGHIEDGALVIEKAWSRMFYENSVTDITITKVADS